MIDELKSSFLKLKKLDNQLNFNSISKKKFDEIIENINEISKNIDSLKKNLTNSSQIVSLHDQLENIMIAINSFLVDSRCELNTIYKLFISIAQKINTYENKSNL